MGSHVLHRQGRVAVSLRRQHAAVFGGFHAHPSTAVPVSWLSPTLAVRLVALLTAFGPSAVASDKEAMGKVLSRTPMLRVGEPSEIGSVVRFLASQDASYMTGQTVYVDGGRMALNYTVKVPEET